MTHTERHIRLSRRRLLAGLGTIGVASAGAGLGTTAMFTDSESFDENRLVAGELDLKVDWQVGYFGPTGFEYIDAFPDMFHNDPENPDELQLIATPQGPMPVQGADNIQDPVLTREEIASNYGEPVDSPIVEAVFRDQFADVPTDLVQPIIELDDVKPGDWGEVTFSLHLFDNPGYLWFTGELLSNQENSVPEPEVSDPDEDNVAPSEAEVDDEGELADEVVVTIWYDDGDNVLESEESVVVQDSLRAVLDQATTDAGIPLDGDPSTSDRDCYPNSTTAYIGFRWELPVDHANEVMTDSVRFDLGFYTEQCRHNDGSGLDEASV